MKHKILNQHRKNLDPKYNPHLKPTYHSRLKTGRHVAARIAMIIVVAIVIIGIVTAGGIWMYRDANDQAKQQINQEVEKRSRPQEPVYNQADLKQRSNHQVAKKMTQNYAVHDPFIKKISYDSKRDVAKVYLTPSAVKAVNYASNVKKPKADRLAKAVQTGVRIDNTLGNQAVQVANAAHDGYFTFTFANAKGYQAPNTKTGNFNV